MLRTFLHEAWCDPRRRRVTWCHYHQNWFAWIYIYIYIWGDQPGLKSEMDQLQGFQNKFAKKVLRKNVSSKEALKTLKWLPLECRRRGHRCELVQNAIKGNIPEHFDNFRSPLNSSHGYNTRNGYLPRLPKVKSDWGRRVTSFQAFNDWMALPMDLRRPMPCNTFKRLLNTFLSNLIIWFNSFSKICIYILRTFDLFLPYLYFLYF